MRRLVARALTGLFLTTFTLACPVLAAHGHGSATRGRRPTSGMVNGQASAKPAPPRSQGDSHAVSGGQTRYGYRPSTFGLAFGWGGGALADGYGGYYDYGPADAEGGYEPFPVAQAYDANGWEVYDGSLAAAPGTPPGHGPPLRYVQAPAPGVYANAAYVQTPGPADRILVSAPYVVETAVGGPAPSVAPDASASPTCGRWTWSNGVITYAWIAC